MSRDSQRGLNVRVAHLLLQNRERHSLFGEFCRQTMSECVKPRILNLGYFLVPYTAGDFIIRGPAWFIPIGKVLIFPLLLSDTTLGLASSIAFDAGLVLLLSSAYRWIRSYRSKTNTTKRS